VSIYSPTSIVPTELTRLQAESAVVTTGVQVAAGTYTSVNVTLATSSGIFINASTSAITVPGGSSSQSTICNPGMVCTLPNGATATVNIPLSLRLAAGQNTWIGLDVNLNNAITSPSLTSIGVDFTLPNTFTAITTPRTGTPSGAFDTIGDFIGTVTALSSTSITVQNTITGQSLTATLNSSTQFDAAPGTYSGCTSATSCLAKGSVVSLDAVLTTSGTFTATELDVLDTVARDEIEGIIYPTVNTATTGVVGMILADKISASGNATLGASTTTFGTGIFLTAGSNINYLIDSKNLTSAPGFNPLGFAGSGDLLAGQQIRAQVTNVASSSSGISATATNVLLRWSRISATIFGVQGSSFAISGLPTYMVSLSPNPGLLSTPLVYSYSPETLFDGVTGTTDPNFVVGKALAIRALYLNNASPTFQAGKVRVP